MKASSRVILLMFVAYTAAFYEIDEKVPWWEALLIGMGLGVLGNLGAAWVRRAKA